MNLVSIPYTSCMESSERQALAELAETVGQALVRYAGQLRTAPPGAESDTSDAAPGRPRGKRQRQVLELAGLKAEPGMAAVEVAQALGISRANVYQLLNGLVDGGWLMEVPGEEPTRWQDRR